MGATWRFLRSLFRRQSSPDANDNALVNLRDSVKDISMGIDELVQTGATKEQLERCHLALTRAAELVALMVEHS